MLKLCSESSVKLMRNFKMKKKRARKKILKLIKEQNQILGVPLEDVKNLTIESVQKIEEQMEIAKKRSKQEQVKKFLRSYIEERQRNNYETLNEEIY